jgi:hypothetical protein
VHCEAFGRKDSNQAIELLKVTSTIELSRTLNLAIFLCPVHQRGGLSSWAHLTG